jgi:hypothetical protein
MSMGYLNCHPSGRPLPMRQILITSASDNTTNQFASARSPTRRKGSAAEAEEIMAASARDENLDALRALMAAHSPPLHALIVPSEDAHQVSARCRCPLAQIGIDQWRSRFQ